MDAQTKIVTRRDFLRTSSALCLGAILMPEALFSKNIIPSTLNLTHDRSLQFYNINSRQYLDVTYYKDGAYVHRALEKINKLMSDKRSGKSTIIDTKLLDKLHTLHTFADAKEPIELICGYRSPKTNEKLTHTKRGVAAHSYHTLGKAADIRIGGVPLSHLQEVAHSLNAGGVGYYPRSNFVHIDVGPTRTWHG